MDLVILSQSVATGSITNHQSPITNSPGCPRRHIRYNAPSDRAEELPMRTLMALVFLLALAPEIGAREIPPAGPEEAVEAPLTVSLYPAPLQTKERLRRLIVDLWCAERRGADDAALMRLYLKHSYPSLQDWHKVWNKAMEDSPWVRQVYDEVREACPIPEDKLPVVIDPPPK